jgi:RES domain-containing protein
MIVFRLSKSKYARDLSGRGSENSGGRWNSKGVPLIYTSESRALCITEIAVHTPLGNIPFDYCCISFEIPDHLNIGELKVKDLPVDWKSFPHRRSTKEIGDRFVLQNKFLVLKVPSAVVQEESNYLINPRHKDIKKIKIGKPLPFEFDERLFKG